MEDQITQKPEPGVVLIVSTIALLALSTFLFYAFAMRRSGDSAYALGYAFMRGIFAPAIVACIFCIPKKSRTLRRFTRGYLTMSGIMLFLALSELGQHVAR
jgi:hypothetical protein